MSFPSLVSGFNVVIGSCIETCNQVITLMSSKLTHSFYADGNFALLEPLFRDNKIKRSV